MEVVGSHTVGVVAGGTVGVGKKWVEMEECLSLGRLARGRHRFLLG